MNAPTMTTLAVDGGHVAYTDSGGPGTPVLLVHAGIFSAWFAPLAAERALAGHRVIRILRAGYAPGSAPTRPLSIADHAAHCAAVLDAVGADRALAVGHSSGSTIVLQLALDRPDVVSGLVLVEPPLIDVLAAPEDLDTLHAALGPVFGGAIAAAGRGDIATAFDTLMSLLCGPGYRTVLESSLGAGGVARAQQESRYFITDEIKATESWEFGPQHAARIAAPVLLVQGGASIAPTHRLVERLAGMLPAARVATIDGDDHLLPLRNPAALAELVAGADAGPVALPTTTAAPSPAATSPPAVAAAAVR